MIQLCGTNTAKRYHEPWAQTEHHFSFDWYSCASNIKNGSCVVGGLVGFVIVQKLVELFVGLFDLLVMNAMECHFL